MWPYNGPLWSCDITDLSWHGTEVALAFLTQQPRVPILALALPIVIATEISSTVFQYKSTAYIHDSTRTQPTPFLFIFKNRNLPQNVDKKELNLPKKI